MPRPPTTTVDPALDAAALLRRIGFFGLFVVLPVAAQVSRRATVVLAPIAVVLLITASAIDQHQRAVGPALKRLEAQKLALDTAASPLGRLSVIARDPDMGIARATYRDYQPAVPTTADGLVAGLLGFFAAWGGWRVTSDVGRHLARRRRRAQPETTPV